MSADEPRRTAPGADTSGGRWLVRVALAGAVLFALVMAVMALRPGGAARPRRPAPTAAPPLEPPTEPTTEPTLPPLVIASVENPTPLPTEPSIRSAPVDWAQPTADPQIVANALAQPV